MYFRSYQKKYLCSREEKQSNDFQTKTLTALLYIYICIYDVIEVTNRDYLQIIYFGNFMAMRVNISFGL